MIEIEFKDVWKQFKKSSRPTLAGMNLQVQQGSIHVLVGHSGAGKSVTLKHVLGLLPPDKGEVWIRGTRLEDLDSFQLKEMRKHFGMLFQNSALFDGLDVYENLAFPLREHRPQMTESEIGQRVEELLESVGLRESIRKMPSDLSGGMRKRVGLARAIALTPDILLFDEPTTGLDPETSTKIDDLIVETTKKLKATSLIISHDLHASLRIADFVSMIWEGQIVETLAPDDFRKSQNPVIREFLRSAGLA